MDELEVGGGTVRLARGDITRSETDAIVNAANSSLMGGGGVDGAIHRAGGPAILAECVRIVVSQGRLPAGQAVLTTAGKMPSRHVIHTVGPVWHGGGKGEPETLASAYSESLRVASEAGLETVAFPSISTGVYGYPVERAAPVALGAVRAHLEADTSVREVVFVLFDDVTYRAYAGALEAMAGV
jgi:O-acetyl-ADP-ribose deacetylase (regulator of RNase III)